MILNDAKLIYLHIQKTGGNSISKLFYPFSEDQITIRKHQDGVNRFGIRGKFTPRKHAYLTEYRDTMGSAMDDYDIVISVRNPLDRAISMYFSPHNWHRKNGESWEAVEPFWSMNRFDLIVNKMCQMSDFLRLDGKTQMPDYIINFDSMREDLISLSTKKNIPLNIDHLPHANQSAGTHEMMLQARQDRKVIELVQSRFQSDYELLERFAA